MRIARRILKKEGWVIKNGVLTHDKTGEILKFEILLRSPLFERIVLPMKRNLKKLGVNVTIRTVQDDSQYIRRLDKFDFDMVAAISKSDYEIPFKTKFLSSHPLSRKNPEQF